MDFPKYVFKRGTGKPVNDAGLFTAESILVESEEALSALGGGWCDSPVEAAEPTVPTASPPPLAERHGKKAK